MPNTGGTVNDPGGVEVKTAKTQKENIRTQKSPNPFQNSRYPKVRVLTSKEPRLQGI